MPAITQSMVKEATVFLPPLVFRHLSDDEGGEDPFLQKFPIGYRDSWLISWDRMGNPYGMTQQGALDAPPVLVSMPGIEVNEIEPGVYREYTRLDESELTKGRELGTLGDPVKVGSRLTYVMNYFAERLGNRIFKIYTDIGTTGAFNNTDSQGNQHSYQLPNYQSLSMSAWAVSPTTATPIDDLRTAQTTLNKGTSSRFGQKSEILMADEAINTLLATTQIRNSFRSQYGASFLAPFDNAQKTGVQPPLNGDRSLNALFFGMGLPKIVPWNRGLYTSFADARDKVKANYSKFLSSTQAVWLGYRPNNQQLGQLSFARHTGLMEQGGADYGVIDMQKPQSVSEFGRGVYLRVHYHNEQPHHYKFEIGANIGMEIWYEDAMATLSWS
jgi:hypothetical protein